VPEISDQDLVVELLIFACDSIQTLNVNFIYL